MPKLRGFERNMPAFYRNKAIDFMMFAHVNAIMNNTNMTIENAIYDFMDLYGLTMEEYPIDSAKVTYNKIKNNFLWASMRDKF